MVKINEKNIVILHDEKYYVLPDHSYRSIWNEQGNEDYSYNYCYVRLPVDGSTTVYEDSPVSLLHLRNDVEITAIDADGCPSVIWDAEMAEPFV